MEYLNVINYIILYDNNVSTSLRTSYLLLNYLPDGNKLAPFVVL